MRGDNSDFGTKTVNRTKEEEKESMGSLNL